MKQLRAVFLLTVLPLFFPFLSGNTVAQAQIPKVLVLNSYSHGFEWTDHIVEAIRSEFRQEGIQADILIEYMDTKAHDPARVFPVFRELLRTKYQNTPLDVIITTDNNAFEFVVANRPELFGDVPVVFCAVNYFEDSMLAGQEGITGVVEDVDIRGTIELALSLNPETEYIAAVSDVTPTDKANRQRLDDIKPFFHDRVAFIDLVGLGADELPRALRELPRNTIILFFDLYRDAKGRSYTLREGIELMQRNTALPVYTMWEDKVYHGFLGGVTVSGNLQGQTAAQKAIEVLKGIPVEDIPILYESPNIPMFNYPRLKEHNIARSTLPPEHVLVNEPDTFFYRHKKYILSGLLFICIQTLIILFLWINVIWRKRAQQALEEANRKRNEAVKAGRIGLWNWDIRTNEVEYSLEWKKQIGYEDHEIGNSYEEWRSRVHPDDLESTEQKVRKCIREFLDNYVVEFRFRHKDGSYRWIRAQASVIADDKGNPVRMLGSHIDITDKKRIEDELRVSSEQYRALYDNAPLAYQSLDENGFIKDVNPAWLRSLGYTRNEVVGRNFADFIDPEQVSSFHSNFSAFKQRGYTHDVEYRIKHKQGHYLEVTFEGRVGCWPDGSFRQTYCVFKDITEQKKARQKLQEREELFRDILDSLPQLVSFTDKDLRYRYVNRAYQDKFGLSQEQMVGRKISEILGESVFQKGYPHIKRALAGEKVRFHETSDYSIDGLLDVDGTLIPVFAEDGSVEGYYAVMTDITPYMQIQNKLEDQEKVLTEILEGVLAGYWDWNIPQEKEYLSPAFKKMFGYEDHELENTPQSWQKLIFEEDLHKALETFDRHVKSRGKEPYSNEVRYRHKDGSTVWVICSGRVIEWAPDGSAVRMVGCHVDITKLKHLETQIATINKAIENSLNGFDIVGEDGKFIYVNKAYVNMWGYDSPEEIIGTAPVLHCVDPKMPQKVINKLKENGSYVFEFKARRKDGTTFDALMHARLDHDFNGREIYLGSSIDITEQNRAREALRESEHQKNLLLNSMSEMMAYYDTDLRVIWANRASGDSVEKISEQLSGMHCYEIWHCREQPCEDCPVLAAKETKQPRQAEIQTPDGRWWFLRGYPILDENENVTALAEFGQDITDRKLAEAEREKLLRQLTYKNKELQSLVYVATHDLRSPLVNIIGFSRELIDNCRELCDFFVANQILHDDGKRIHTIIENEIPEALGFITAGTEKMLQQLNGLLRVSRVGSVAVNIELLDMNRLMEQVVNTFQYKAKEKGVKIEIEPLPRCRGDYALVSQAFSNLVDNALKYMDPDRPGHIRITGCLEDEFAAYTIEDNGIGIAPEYRERIFEVFHRLNPRDAVGGEGLGLTIVTRALDRMNGSIRLESTLNKGSRFFVSLPAE